MSSKPTSPFSAAYHIFSLLCFVLIMMRSLLKSKLPLCRVYASSSFVKQNIHQNTAHLYPVTSSLSVPKRFCASGSSDSSPEAIAGKWKKSSTIAITSFNVEQELVRSTVPTLLVFYSDMHPVSKEFMKRVKAAAMARNEKTLTLSVRVATVSCDQEMAIARQFQADRIGIPLTYMLYKGQMLDRLTGDLDAATLEKAMDAFVKAATERFGFEGQSGAPQADEAPTDEKSPSFHIREAKKMLETPDADLSLIDAALDNAQKLCAEPVAAFKKSIGFGQKRVTPEMITKMKENPDIRCMAQALGVHVATALRRGDMPAAQTHADHIRREFGWILKEDRTVARDVVLVEISSIAQYDSAKHDQAYFDAKDDADELQSPRRACRHYTIGEDDECINVLLGTIRGEAQKRGASAGQSKARQMILKCFEALGTDSEVVQTARKTLSRYLFC